MYYNSLIKELNNTDEEYEFKRIKDTKIFEPIENKKTELIESIRKIEDMSSTDIEAVVRCRRGQGRFKNDLIRLWRKCCVTGYADKELLTASHIKPWKNSTNEERLDKFNGFLLTPNLDKLFDRGFITFSCDDGKIIISKKLKDAEALGINPNMQIALFNENKKYLEYHNEVVFKDNKKKK